MNSKQINKVFNTSENLSRKDIDTYRETTDETIKHSIEEKSLGSDFDSDALEGWTNSSVGTSAMKSMDQKYSTTSSTTKWLFTGGIIAVIVTFIIFLLPQEKSTNHVASKLTENPEERLYEKTDLVLPEAIEEMKELPKKKQISIVTIQKDYTIQQENIENEPLVENKNPKSDVEEVSLKPIESVKIDKEISKKQNFAKEIYLKDLKLIDYRNYRSKPVVKTELLILEGTPASKEHENSKIEEDEMWKTVEIPYIEYIDKTMAVFAKGNFKKALSRFEVILKTYPTDLNANLYGGLCYFNLGEYEKAIETFEKCLDSEFNNFNEEAEWYLAKSYQANGNKEKANELFKQIREGGGYYSKQVRN